jgi:hypothetical protein
LTVPWWRGVEDLEHVAGVHEDGIADGGFRAGEQARVHGTGGLGADERHRDAVVVGDPRDHADRAQAHR